MYKSVGSRFYILASDCLVQVTVSLLPLMVPCIGEAAGGVLEAGLRKVSGKA